jgi:hypothetical protein
MMGTHQFLTEKKHQWMPCCISKLCVLCPVLDSGIEDHSIPRLIGTRQLWTELDRSGVILIASHSALHSTVSTSQYHHRPTHSTSQNLTEDHK